jgi:hypothetical protein
MDLKTLVRTNADRVVAVGLVLLGGVILVLGWIGVSGTGLAAEQIPYLVSGGIGGLLMVIVGCTTWVSADLQDEWRRLDAIEEHLASLARNGGSLAVAPRATDDLEVPTHEGAPA